MSESDKIWGKQRGMDLPKSPSSPNPNPSVRKVDSQRWRWYGREITTPSLEYLIVQRSSRCGLLAWSTATVLRSSQYLVLPLSNAGPSRLSNQKTPISPAVHSRVQHSQTRLLHPIGLACLHALHLLADACRVASRRAFAAPPGATACMPHVNTPKVLLRPGPQGKGALTASRPSVTHTVFQQFRGQWTRPRNAPPHQHSDRAVVTGPPIMPSTQTRTKLRAFQFEDTLPLDPEKENRPAVPGKTSTKETPKTNKVVKDIDNAFETPRLPQSKSLPPSTPAARLPLADLVGNTDDTSRHAALAALSPEEQLYWRGSQPVNTPVPRKTKKRAHSSSPVGPSQDEPRLSVRKTGLTTPQADPATELWSRYTSNKGTPTVAKSVAFAHLINESSPRSAAAAGSVSGLRRWASCGVEFPASTSKRRKTHGIFEGDQPDDLEDVFAAAPSSDSVMQGQALSTNLASIVERMKQSISNSQEQPPSSFSPLPDAGPAPIADPESPLKRHTPRGTVEEETSGTLQAENCAVEDELVTEDQDLSGRCEGSQLAEEQRSCASSDDFGEVDFDADMADAANAATLEAEVSQIHPSVPAEPAPPLADSEDDFGIGDDDDIFAADLEQVASLFDNRPLESPTQLDSVPEAAPTVSAVPVIDLVNDDSDDFGDDIDAEEFAAAEIAATQTPATNTVCRARTSLNETV